MPELRITVNGVERAVDPSHSIRDVLQAVGIPPEGTAVAVNDHVVPRSQHGDVRLQHGDRVEIVHAVAGG